MMIVMDLGVEMMEFTWCECGLGGLKIPRCRVTKREKLEFSKKGQFYHGISRKRIDNFFSYSLKSC